MMVAAIVACEIGFWLVLALGFALRYLARRTRASAVVLGAVPLVDLALLVLTVVDLRRGGDPGQAHGLAAVYLGFSVAFGPRLVRWADARVAYRWAGGPKPTGRPPSGTVARVRNEWSEFGLACLAGAISVVLLLAAVGLVGSDDAAPLWGWQARVGVVLAIWLVVGPLTETVRAATRRTG